VIATGGSVVYSPKAMEHLSRISTIIYLSIDLELLLTKNVAKFLKVNEKMIYSLIGGKGLTASTM